MNARSLILSIFAAAFAMAFWSAPALAAREYVPTTHAFGEPCSGSPCGKGQFKEPTGVAVNGSDEPLVQPFAGDVYVIDTGDSRVERFSETGVYQGQFNGAGDYETEGKTESGPATPAGSFEFSGTNDANGIAVDGSSNALDPSLGDVYVADVGRKVVDKFSAVGEYQSQLTGTCPKPGTCTVAEVIPFAGELLGVAVDPAGNVWVYTNGREQDIYDEFSATGAFIDSFLIERGYGWGLGVDASDDIYAVTGLNRVSRVEAGGERAEFGSEHSTALTVDQLNGSIFVDNGGEIELFGTMAKGGPRNPSPIQVFGHLTESHGIAVDGASAAGWLYTSQTDADTVTMFEGVVLHPEAETEPASGVTETTATLHGTVVLEGMPVTECKFEYGIEESYGESVPCKQTLAEINALSKGGTAPVQVSAEVSSLTARSTYGFRLTAADARGAASGAGQTLYTFGRAAIESASIADIGSTEATVSATLSPGGEPTTYRVEYGTADVEEFSTPEASASASQPPVEVQVTLSNLHVSTAYRARVVATNKLGSGSGSELTFTTTAAQVVTAPTQSTCPNRTFTGFNPAMPDCRAYELVSNPINETYAPHYDESSLGTGELEGDAAKYRASTDSEAIAYAGGESRSGVGGSGHTGGQSNLYIAERGEQGWRSTNISMSTHKGIEPGDYSPDLSVEVLPAFPFEVGLESEVAPGCASQREQSSLFSRIGGTLHALVSFNQGSGICDAYAAGISANDSHILLESTGPFTAEAKQGLRPGHNNLYDSVDGVLHQVNILPDGEAEQDPFAAFGARYELGENEDADQQNDISPDGTRVIWTALAGRVEEISPKALYMRENDSQPQSQVVGGGCTVSTDACTVQLDATQGGSGSAGGGFFWGASTDDSRVFFTDCSRLTADSTADSEEGCGEFSSAYPQKFTGNDLYEYDVEKPVGERLTDLTVDHNPGDVLGADVQGVVGVSEDGSSVYFVADGVLAGGNAEGKSPIAGQPNLYLGHGGGTTFIATLESTDNDFHQGGSGGEFVGDWVVSPGLRSAEVAPSGGAIGFTSRLELTGYDNYGIVSYAGEPPELSRGRYGHIPELFIYEASSGHIVCASCSPTGAPVSPPRAGPDVDENGLEGTTVGWSESSSFMRKWIIEREGTQVYFMTDQPLVADDSNGLQDVYEWASDGSGGCQRAAGCVGLISTAEPLGDAYFVEAAAGGRDVFFTERSPLTPGATGETLKLYDARADGGLSEPSLACTGTGCQGIPGAPPIFATPSSATFNGVGNFEPAPPAVVHKPKPKSKPKRKAKKCGRGLRRRHGRCVRSRARKAGRSIKSTRGGGKR